MTTRARNPSGAPVTGRNTLPREIFDAEMAGLQRAIWDEISRIAESYKSELQIARSQEEAIDKRMQDVFQNSGSTRQSQVRLRELETAANTYRGIYETFLSRFTQSVQQQSFPSTEARLVTFASAPRVPSSPKIALTMALATLCGLGLGVVAAFAREQMNRQIHTRAQIEELLEHQLPGGDPNVQGQQGSSQSAAAEQRIAEHSVRSSRRPHFPARPKPFDISRSR